MSRTATSTATGTACPKTGRRFQFGLKTFLVAVTLFALLCAYAAREYGTVVKRRDWLASHRVTVEIDITDAKYFHKLARADASQNQGWVRLQLGDAQHNHIFIPAGAPQATVQEAVALFPEAEILELPRGYR